MAVDKPSAAEQKWIDAAFAALDADSIETTDDDAYLRTVLRILWPVVEPLVTRAQAVRDLHQRGEIDGDTFCTHCTTEARFTGRGTTLTLPTADAWPCDTVRALDGDDG